MEPLVALNRERFDHELTIRGITARQLCRVAGVDEMTLSRARTGRTRMRPGTVRKLGLALKAHPVIPGTELMVTAPDKKTPAASTSAGVQEANGGLSTDAPAQA